MSGNYPASNQDEAACANCGGAIHHCGDKVPEHGPHWYHVDTGNVRCPIRFAEPHEGEGVEIPPQLVVIQGIVERAGKARAELAELLHVPAVWPSILSAVKSLAAVSSSGPEKG